MDLPAGKSYEADAAPVAGILTGISYVSGVDYYGGINKRVAELLPNGSKMASFPEIVLVSLDCAKYVGFIQEDGEEEMTRVAEYLLSGVRKINNAGADFLVIASNTAHLIADKIAQEIPNLPLLHIADAAALEAKRFGAKKVGILGTKPVMGHPTGWLKKRFHEHGLETLVPEQEYHEECYRIICDELTFDIFKPESREFYLMLVQRLAHAGADTVLLGCTEIELLMYAEGEPTTPIPLIRSAATHIEAVAQVQARKKKLSDYLPAKSL